MSCRYVALLALLLQEVFVTLISLSAMILLGTYGNSSGLSKPQCSGLCPPGYFCPINSPEPLQHPCPAGRYGSTSGMYNSACTAQCSAGYYCPPASTSPTQVQCGASMEQPNSVFCGVGSAVPTVAHVGYFTINGNLTTR